MEKNPPLTSMKLASRAPLSESNVAVVKDHNLVEREKIIWNFDNVQKAYATRGCEAKKQVS
jgi:hypothetical protein